LTPDEFREARGRLGLTQKGIARELKMGKHAWQSVSDWERGVRPIPGPVSVAVALMLEKM
jgi:DNA-binding transcriptional regulator YiaG